MTCPIPPRPSSITTSWLEKVLAAHCPGDRPPKVHAVDVAPAEKWNQAEVAFLRLDYARNPTGLSSRLFVKLRGEPDPLCHIFPGEHRFYQEARGADLPIAPCLAAFVDETTGATCILLEDLRETHIATEWPLPPSLDRCKAALASLAKVHAHWHQNAGPELEAREAMLSDHVAGMLPGFLAMMEDRLPKDRADRLIAACAQTLALKTGVYHSGRTVTRVHGDAHFWNVLYPKTSMAGEAILIDWEDWRVDFAGTDLALMIAMHWYPDRRARHEKDLLRHYLCHLNEHADRAVTWDELWRAYRLGHVCNAAIPIFQQAAGTPHASWWSHLERWFLAFEDLQCDEFL